MSKYTYIVCLIFIVAFETKANTLTNIQKIDSLYNEIAIQLSKNISECDGIYIEAKDGWGAERLEQAIFKIANKNEIKLYSEKMPNTCSIKLNIDNLAVRYIETEDKKIFEREIAIKTTIQIISPKAEIKILEYEEKSKDNLNLAEIEVAETRSPEYAKGKIPEKNSFFDKILKPVVIIGGAIVAVVLLFTVRS